MPRKIIIKKNIDFLQTSNYKEIEKNKNVVICLSVYNNEFGLPYCLKNIKKIKDVFDKLNIVVFYDNSKDKSLEILNNFKKNENIDIDIIINKNKKFNLRTANIAHARNSLLKIIREKYNDYYYFIMMDTNEYACVGEINRDLIYDVIHNEKYDYDALSFDREAGYYDTWALSFDPYIYSFFHFNNWEKVVDNMRLEFNKLLNNHEKNNLISVYSSFNGFCIYKTNKFINCSYSSNIDKNLFPEGSIKKQETLVENTILNKLYDDCEHRKFHLEAIKKNNAKIRICKNYIFFKFKNPHHSSRGPS